MHADGLPRFSENVLCGSAFVVELVSGVTEIKVADGSCVVVWYLAVVVGISELAERLMAGSGDIGVVAKLLSLLVLMAVLGDIGVVAKVLSLLVLVAVSGDIGVVAKLLSLLVLVAVSGDIGVVAKLLSLLVLVAVSGDIGVVAKLLLWRFEVIVRLLVMMVVEGLEVTFVMEVVESSDMVIAVVVRLRVRLRLVEVGIRVVVVVVEVGVGVMVVVV